MRELGLRARRAHGIDVGAQLVTRARELGGGTFDVVAYDELVTDPTIAKGPRQAIVCNFSLLGDPVHRLLSALRKLLAPSGALLIQTVHPCCVRGNAAYESGWRTELFDAFAVTFPRPMPWYYRTLEAWFDEVALGGLRVTTMHEPVGADAGAARSLLLRCERA